MEEDKKKLFDYEQDERIRKALEAQDEKNDKEYAIKLVEKIVFTAVGAMGLTILGILVKVATDYLRVHI